MAFDMNIGDSRSMIVRLSEKSHERDFVYDFQPPMTLGKPKKNSKEYKPCMAMDACIRNVLSGFKNDLMYTTTPMFVGYAMLSNVSQEALIRAGVETVASEMVRKFVQWTYDDDYGEEEKEKAIADLENQAAKYKLRETFYNASVKDGYFGGCLVYIDVGDLDDEEKEEPLILDEKTFKKGSLRGFKVIEPINIYPGEYNTTDPTDEHYFNPEYWYILGKKYHASRFLYFASNEAPLLLKPAYNFFGIPQAQLALDYVAHFVANREAAQELLNKFSLTCWKTNMGQALQGKSCKDLMERAKMLIKTKSNNGIMILDKEQEDFVQLNTPLSGVRDIVEMSLNLLTAVWHIPKIEYLGEGEGGLNASSKEQIRSYYDYIMGKKEKDYTQPLETVLKIFQLNLGKGINPALGFKFPPMWDMDDSERAALNKQQADRDAIYLANGVLSQEEVRRRLSLDRNSEYTMIDVDDVPETQEEPLKEVDEQEENEQARQAMDMAMDDRWITIGARKATETDEGRKGRHILLKEGETPVEAIERTTGTDIDKNGKVGKTDQGEKKEQPKEEGKKEPEQKSETEKKPESKSEEKKEEPKTEKDRSEEIKTLVDSGKYGKLSKAYVNDIKSSLTQNLNEYPEVLDVVKNVGSIQALSREQQKNALVEKKDLIENTISSTIKTYMDSYGEDGIARQFGSVERFKEKVRKKAEDRIKKAYQIRASGETAHFSWYENQKRGEIRFNEGKFLDDMPLRLQVAEYTKFHPVGCSSVKSTVDHEFGHAIERYIVERNKDSKAYNELHEYYIEVSRSGKMGERLSRYAETDFSEFIAEGYSEYKNNKPPREVAQKIGELLTKAYMEAKNV